MKHEIILPSKPTPLSEEGNRGQYEINGLYPGYGHTLGNSLRRIILSSLPGAAITTVKIDGVSHEFSTLEGVREDVITILLNLKRVQVRLDGDEAVTFTAKFKGEGEHNFESVDVPGQIEIVNPDQPVVTITKKSASVDMEVTVEKGLGYVSRDVITKGKADIGVLALDAIFSPIRRVNYEVENMRVGDRTDYNKLRIFIETDGTISPREVLEKSVEIMIAQLRAIMGVEDPFSFVDEIEEANSESENEGNEEEEEDTQEQYKTRVESLGLSTRTENALINANIRTVGGIVAKSELELLEYEGVGAKALEEIHEALDKLGLSLKS